MNVDVPASDAPPPTDSSTPKPSSSTSRSALPFVYESDTEADQEQLRIRTLEAEHAAAIEVLMEYEQNMPPVPLNTNTHTHAISSSNSNSDSTTPQAAQQQHPPINTTGSSSSPRPPAACSQCCCSSGCSPDNLDPAQTAEYALLDEPMLPQHALHVDSTTRIAKKSTPPKTSSDDLRANIVAISSNPALTPSERDAARQRLYTSKYARQKNSEAIAYAAECERNKHTLSYSQYKDAEGNQLLGCVHYARNCKIQAPCCGMWVVCRRCHDVSCITPHHTIDRFKIQRILCMVCNTEQDIAEYCCNESCGVKFADYYCYHCRFFDNAPGKEIYHCDKCKICRVGKGLGRDNYHCDHCNACVSLEPDGKDAHRCLRASLDADCPICGDYMLTSTTQVVFMQCGHAMHHSCFDTYTATNYVCPICAKTLTDMSPYYRQIDEAVEQQPLPEEFRDRKVEIRCHNCDIRCITKFHFIYLKCVQCNGYNTRLIRDRNNEEHVRVLATDG